MYVYLYDMKLNLNLFLSISILTGVCMSIWYDMELNLNLLSQGYLCISIEWETKSKSIPIFVYTHWVCTYIWI
jgi:hypothetical protein